MDNGTVTISLEEHDRLREIASIHKKAMVENALLYVEKRTSQVDYGHIHEEVEVTISPNLKSLLTEVENKLYNSNIELKSLNKDLYRDVEGFRHKEWLLNVEIDSLKTKLKKKKSWWRR